MMTGPVCTCSCGGLFNQNRVTILSYFAVVKASLLKNKMNPPPVIIFPYILYIRHLRTSFIIAELYTVILELNARRHFCYLFFSFSFFFFLRGHQFQGGWQEGTRRRHLIIIGEL